MLAAFPVTLQLTLASLVLACALGIPLGVLAGTRQGSGLDAAVLAGTLFGVSMPIFWLGLMLLILFAAGLNLLPTGGVMPVGQEPPPVTGMSVVDSVLAGDPALVRIALLHLVLPAVTLATIPLALITRVTRAEVIAAGLLDHVRTARAKGLRDAAGGAAARAAQCGDPDPDRGRAAARAAAVGGGADGEIYSLPGLGRLMVDSILSRDYPVAQAAAMFVAGHLRGGEFPGRSRLSAARSAGAAAVSGAAAAGAARAVPAGAAGQRRAARAGAGRRCCCCWPPSRRWWRRTTRSTRISARR